MADSLSLGSSFQRHLDHIPAAFAVTRGPEHALVYANAAFRALSEGVDTAAIGRPIVDALLGRDRSRVIALLDGVFRTGAVARDQSLDPVDEGAASLCCSVWPEIDEQGRPGYLLIEVHETPAAELSLALQRELAGQMLLSALGDRDATERAEAASRSALYLAAEGRRLAESLDEHATLSALTRLALPREGAWCIVDVIESDGRMRRLAIVHPDPEKQALLRELEGRWSPMLGDPFGAPVAIRNPGSTVITAGIDDALAAASHDPETLRILQAVGAGSLLTVPLAIRDELAGAITFISGAHDHPYTTDDMKLAEDLAIRSAMALNSARLHGVALTLRAAAEEASRVKSEFLGTMSHELRTPLNAIGGYVELIDMGLRGPVTDAQHVDLGRIRSNQQHLMGLITDTLNLVRLGAGRVKYAIADVPVYEVLSAAFAMVEPLMLQKPIVHDPIECDRALVVRADGDKVIQILVNLFSNAIKFTPAGGRIDVGCEADAGRVHLYISDTGIGIPEDKIDIIFDPFVQVKEGLAGRDAGVGLGLAISRDLARAMEGDLTVRSVLGQGSRFTVTLPRGKDAVASG